MKIGGTKQPIPSPMGKDAIIFQHTDDRDPDSTGFQFVAQTRSWFNSIWDTIAKPAP